MRRLITITLLTALMITSKSLAQSDEKVEPLLLAKADEKIKGTFERESINNINRSNANPDHAPPEAPGASKLGNDSRDISLLIKNELNLESSLDLEYKAPRLKAEQLPLLMSSKDRKTEGVVFPPFLYFKKQF